MSTKTCGKFIDMSGQVFGMLTAIRYEGRTKWLFSCECGGSIVTAGYSVRNGLTKSCGCKTGEWVSAARTTHGYAKVGRVTVEFNTWAKMIGRCHCERDSKYKDYGGRGITVCDRWRTSFENFLADMGERPSIMHSIDRIDVNGDYHPENCRWATIKQQSLNKRGTVYMTLGTVYMTLGTEKKALMEWAEIIGCSPFLLYDRRKKGWTDREALLTPVRGKRKKAG